MKEPDPQEEPSSFNKDEHKATMSFKRELGELEQVDEEESTFCFPSIRKMRGFKSFIVLILGGIILFGSAALYLMLSNGFNIIDLSTPSEEQEIEFFNKINSTDAQISRWSVWITLVWVAYVLIWFFVSLLPGLIIYGIILIFGYCSEQMRLKIEYITALQPWIVWGVWQVLATVSYFILFIQMKHRLAPKYWWYMFQFLFCTSIFSAVFFAQRLFVQKIAFDFHKVAYADRIIQSKRSLLVLQKLKKSIKGFGLKSIIDIFDTDIHLNEKVNTDQKDREVYESEYAHDHDNYTSQSYVWSKFFAMGKSKLSKKSSSTSETAHEVIDFAFNPDNDNATTHVDELPTLKKRKTIKETIHRRLEKSKTTSSKINIGRKNKFVPDFMNINSDEYATNLGMDLFRALAGNQRNSTELTVANFRKYFATEGQAKQVFAVFDRMEMEQSMRTN
jgi:hypothetical protein